MLTGNGINDRKILNDEGKWIIIDDKEEKTAYQTFQDRKWKEQLISGELKVYTVNSKIGEGKEKTISTLKCFRNQIGLRGTMSITFKYYGGGRRLQPASKEVIPVQLKFTPEIESLLKIIPERMKNTAADKIYGEMFDEILAEIVKKVVKLREYFFNCPLTKEEAEKYKYIRSKSFIVNLCNVLKTNQKILKELNEWWKSHLREYEIMNLFNLHTTNSTKQKELVLQQYSHHLFACSNHISKWFSTLNAVKRTVQLSQAIAFNKTDLHSKVDIHKIINRYLNNNATDVEVLKNRLTIALYTLDKCVGESKNICVGEFLICLKHFDEFLANEQTDDDFFSDYTPVNSPDSFERTLTPKDFIDL
ncbi:hypothetical protein SNEBB_005634 [Seison nebaliae]|nr:hypothetical protein SNEBB_005634 [Seison nebaliae]